jgi:acid phosphatase (class A)
MNNKFENLLILFLLSASIAFAQKKSTNLYLSLDQVPNAVNYLPAPPDTASLSFVDDFNQYLWGKTQRNNPKRVEQARFGAVWDLDSTLVYFSSALGMTITKERTPKLYHLVEKYLNSTYQAVTKAKKYYFRRRPYAQFNEHTIYPMDEEDLLHDGSYPSGHTNRGWCLALLLSEINPTRQDTIISCGYQYGINRVIAGFHWQSDVDAAFTVAAAAYARIHADTQFCKDLEYAKKEYIKISKTQINNIPSSNGFLPVDQYASVRKFMPAPPDTMNIRMFKDYYGYWQGKGLRTERGSQAITDAAAWAKDIATNYSKAFGSTINKQTLPKLLTLMEKVSNDLYAVGKFLKNQSFRKRPYVRFGEGTIIPSEEASHIKSSSYPSYHTLAGWMDALLLTEINPTRSEEILKRGFDYGQSRVIAGYHWQSDVDAARIQASVMFARLHAVPEFVKELDAAKNEYSKFLATSNSK